MPDLYFHNPQGENEGRQLRARHQALSELVDRVPRGSGSGTARRLVQIFDGGAIPSSPDHWFLSHPVELDGNETEGGSVSPTGDTDQTIPVVVLGSAAAVGDLLIAHAIGGRWVAELRAPSEPFATCITCDVPAHALTLTETGTGTFAPWDGIVVTLATPAPAFSPYHWQSAVGRYTFGSLLYYYFGMNCTSDQVNGNGWTIDNWSSVDGVNWDPRPVFSTNSASSAGTAIMVQDSIICGDPFEWIVHTCAAGNCGIGKWTWTITS